MIALRLRIDPLPIVEPLIVRLRDDRNCDPKPEEAVLVSRHEDYREYDFEGFGLTVHVPSSVSLDGDVLMIMPGQKSAHRLIRADSQHNTFLVTEQCDQLCVMCSQPPKKHHTDLFAQFEEAAKLAPAGAYIGISGGEPLLHKQRLFAFLLNIRATRPDLRFHILTNAQHFESTDMDTLDKIGRDRVLWGIPLYSSRPEIHDEIVGKSNAFETLETNLALLMRAGATVELRTVIMRQNADQLPELADYIAMKAPFINVWAIMQLENIGYGRMNWAKIFQDTSVTFQPVKTAINLATAHGLEVTLYNFPLCSVPPGYRQFASSAISDWKQKYLGFCDGCNSRLTCGGFFEWYNHAEGFHRVGAI